jgi:hypothetical protein
MGMQHSNNVTSPRIAPSNVGNAINLFVNTGLISRDEPVLNNTLPRRTIRVTIVIGGLDSVHIGTASRGLDSVQIGTASREILTASLGTWDTPPNLSRGTEEILPPHGRRQGGLSVPVVTLYYQVSTKLSAHHFWRRARRFEHYEDLVFLIKEYGERIFDFRGLLDVEHKRNFYADFLVNKDRRFGLSKESASHALGLS